MYRRKTTVIIVICAAILLMGVGYAILSTQLNINGSTAVTSSWQVEFSGIRTTNQKGGATNKKNPTYTSTTANFEVDLVQPGDELTYEIDITNYGDIKAEVKSASYDVTGSEAIYMTVSGIRKGTIIGSCEGLSTCPKVTAKITIGYNPLTTSDPSSKTKTIKLTLNVGQYVSGSPTPDGELVPDIDAPKFPTYKIGQQIKLPGSTAEVYEVNSSAGTFTGPTYQYSVWSVVKQDATTVTLLSDAPLNNSYGSGSSTVPYDDFQFVYDRAGWCSACQFNASFNYTYNGVSARVPTLDDLSEILTVNGNRYTLKGTFVSANLWVGAVADSAYNAAGATRAGMLVRDTTNNKDIIIVDPAEENIVIQGSTSWSLSRPAITLSKADIPNQNNF